MEGVRKGIWPSTITGTELDGKTVGLLGFGHIGKTAGSYDERFSGENSVYDAYIQDKDPEKWGVTFVDSQMKFLKTLILLVFIFR